MKFCHCGTSGIQIGGTFTSSALVFNADDTNQANGSNIVRPRSTKITVSTGRALPSSAEV